LVGRLLDGHGGGQAAHTHRAQDGQNLPVTSRRGFVDALASKAAAPEPRHQGGYAVLIQINQPPRRDGADRFEELPAPLAVGFGVALDRVWRLFSAAARVAPPTPGPKTAQRHPGNDLSRKILEAHAKSLGRFREMAGVFGVSLGYVEKIFRQRSRTGLMERVRYRLKPKN
jgi:hypothetical protein